jgi:DNA modification methylase
MTALVEYCADSFAMMRACEDAAVDVIITDPAYPKEVQENMCSGSLVGTKSGPKYELDFPALSRKQCEWVLDGVRIARRWVVTFCSVESFGRYQDLAPESYVRGAIWYKSNSMGQLTRDRPATAYEGIGILHGTQGDSHPKKRWNGRGSYGIWRCNGTRGKKDRHPTEKPLALCLKLVALFSERGETVFDPFCGSGAIGVACAMLGRNYIGLDNDREWVEKASARVARVKDDVTDEEARGLCRMPKVSELAGDEEDA